MDNRESGALGERIAAAFLLLKGYRLMDTNYRYARREIDLVVRDGNCVVAVEVKMRRSARFGRAVQAVDPRKLARVRQALVGWSLGPGERTRIDVVAIDLTEAHRRMTVEHYIGV